MGSRHELLEEARRSAAAMFASSLVSEGDVDTRSLTLTAYGRMWKTGVILRLAERRCEHLTSDAPQPAFGFPWAPGLLCGSCLPQPGEQPWMRAGFVASCGCCAQRDVDLSSFWWLWGAYVVCTTLCRGCTRQLVVEMSSRQGVAP